MWYLRSAEYPCKPAHRRKLSLWMRVLGDTIFAPRGGGHCWFVLGLKTGWSFTDTSEKHPTLKPRLAGPLPWNN